jgi:GGDEF domain-containing protein
MGNETLANHESVQVKTRELIGIGKNIDPVTGYPYLTTEVEEYLDSFLADNKSQIIFIVSDIDHLKRANDILGYEVVNMGIRHVITDQEEQLALHLPIRDLFTFRPQAGGDECFFLATLKTTPADLGIFIADASGLLHQPTHFNTQGGQEYDFECSTGIVVCPDRDSYGNKPNLEALRQSAELILAQTKEGKIQYRLQESLIQTRGMNLADAIQYLSNEWGSTRITPHTLKRILNYIANKAGQ